MTHLRLLLAATVLLTAGCSWQAPPERTNPAVSAPAPRTSAPAAPQRRASARDASAMVAATVAQQQLGVPYRYGGAAPDGFDCSGLVHYAYLQAGLPVPRTTREQWRATQPVARNALQPGDVLFFDIDGKPSHVGLYVGDGYFVHAPSTGRVVSTASLTNDYYDARLIRGGRFVRR